MRYAILTMILAGGALPGRAAPMGDFSATVNDAKGKPVEGAVVFAYEVKSGSFKPPSKPYVMDQVKMEFEPKLLPILVGGSVKFPNKDAIHHHLYSFSKAKKFEVPLYKADDADPVVFDTPGVVKVGCNIHDWMQGIILVLSNPYFATTDAKGRAAMKVPSGESIQFAVFHPLLRGKVEKTLKKASIGKGSAALSWSLNLKTARRKKKKGYAY